MSYAAAVHARYLEGDLDFEDARDELNALDPEDMRDVLALATAKHTAGKDLLVMVLADRAYPPALPHMRRWLDDPDLERFAIPAACALAQFAAERFDVDDLYNQGVPAQRAMIAAIAAWWDSGGLDLPSEEAWITQRGDEQRRDVEDEPPPAPTLSADENALLDPQIIELKQALAQLPPATQHRLDVAAIERVLPIYAAFAPQDRVVTAALAAIADYLAGGEVPTAWDKPLRDATHAANAAAGFSPVYQRYRVPAAKAAGHVAQGVLYALSTDVRNRLQAMHNARDAIEYAGRGFEAVRAELAWQLAQVRTATS